MKIIKKTLFFLSLTLPSTWIKKLSKRQKLYFEVGIGAILVVLIPLALASWSRPEQASAAWYNDQWGYRQNVTVTNNGSAQTDYQAAFTLGTASLITAGKMKSDCSDIRVTDTNGKLLKYWLEYCSTSGSTSSVIWVTNPSISVGTSTLYVYYGNPSASNTSAFSSLPTGINPGTGNDGAITVSANSNINTATMISGRSCADGGDAVNYSVTENRSSGTSQIVLSTTPASGCLAAGDEVIIINLQGTSGDNSNVGKYETARISSISTATLTLNHSLANSYDGTTQKIMVQRLPNYTNVTVNVSTTLNASAWDGTKGGVLAFRANGTVTVTGTISTLGLGYAGGALIKACSIAAATQGETYSGTGSQSASNNSGGGGGGYINYGNCTRSGAGGGYSTSGGAGTGEGGGGCTASTGGSTYGASALTTLFMGSGGGGGGGDCTQNPTNGAAGSGIVYIGSGTITVTGSISANGAAASTGSPSGGGGGAAGSVFLQGSTVTLGSSLVTASGGLGSQGTTTGGTGGNGRIATNYSTTSGTTSPSTTATALPVTGSPATEEKAPGPIAYWKFDDGTGTNANNSTTTSGINGTLNGAVAWQTEDGCMIGKCIKFPGAAGDFVAVTDNTALDIGTNDFTLGAWIRLNYNANDQSIIIEKRVTGAPYTGYVLYYQASSSGGCTNAIHFQVNAGTLTDKCVTTGSDIRDNKWHYIAVSVTRASSTGGNFYLDGVQIGTGQDFSSQTATIANAIDLRIGRSVQFTTDSLAGFIDEPKVYNFARSAAQVKQDYASGLANAGSPEGGSTLGAKAEKYLSEGLVGYWKMDESSLTRADSSGNANTLTDNGTVTSTTGQYGNAGQFTRANTEYLSSLDNASLSINGTDSTFTLWFYADSTPSASSYMTLLSKWASGTQAEYYLWWNSATNVIEFGISSGGTYGSQQVTLPAPSTGAWHFLVAKHINGTSVSLQMDNGTVTTVAATLGAFDGTSLFSIGGKTDQLTTAGVWNGRIEDVRLYKRALSPVELTNLYNFAPGPVAYYNFEEKTGSTNYDTSGNANSGTLAGNATWSTGKYGAALSLDGTGDWSSVGAVSPASLAGGNFTLCSWIKTSGTEEDIISNGISTNGNYLLMTYLGKLRGHVWYTANSNVIDSTATVNDNLWHYGCQVVNDTQILLYIDGKLDNSATLSGTKVGLTGTLVVGSRDAASASYNFNGQIDETKIYNYARTQKQIVEDMNAGHPSVGSPVGSAVGYWKFDEGADNTCSGGTNDACNSGNQGSTLDGAESGMAVPATSTSGWTQAGKFGKAMSFDGTSDYINVGSSTSFDFSTTNDFTLAAWIQTTSSSANIILGKWNSGCNLGYDIRVNTVAGKATLRVYDGTASDVNSNTTVNDGNWHYIVGTRSSSGTVQRIYVDGRLDNSATVTARSATITGSMTIGRSGSCSGSYFSGQIDEVKVYNYALTADEVKLDMNRSSSLVLGALSDNSSYQVQAANQEYCIPGDSTSCVAPVGRWNFEEGSGSTANDTSGNANTGTWAGTGSRWTTGKIGKGGNFNGSDDYVSNTSAAPTTTVSSWTIEGWINPSSLSQSGMIFYNGRDNGGYGLLVGNGAGGAGSKLSGLFGAVVFIDSGYTFPSVNQWYHVAMTRDGTTTKFYVNGVQTTGTSTSTPGAVAARYSIGMEYHATLETIAHAFSGKIDEVKIFNYTRSAAQVAWDYNRGAPIGHWKFDECQGTVVNDSSGNGNSGTVTVGATGTYTSMGTCPVSSASTMWYNGVSGKRNYSLAFDGTDDSVVSTSTPLNWTSTTPFSFGGWFYLNNTTTGYMLASNDGVGAGALIASISKDGFVSGKVSMIVGKSGTGQTNIDSSVAYATGSWEHYMAVYDGANNMTLYRNGVSVATGTYANGAATSSGSGVYMMYASNSTNYVNGRIDDARVYNYALTATQIKTLYNDGTIRFGPVTGAP